MSAQESVKFLNNGTKCRLTLNGKYDTLRHEDGSVVVENFTGSIVIEGEKPKETTMATSTPNTASLMIPPYTPVDCKKICTPNKEATQDNSDKKDSNKEKVNDSISSDDFSDGGYVYRDRGLSQQVNFLDEEFLMQMCNVQTGNEFQARSPEKFWEKKG
jgi:hypothetical protein